MRMQTRLSTLGFRLSALGARLLVFALAGAVLVTPLDSLAAQTKQSKATKKTTLDRTRMPEPGARAALRVPEWTRTRLSNGAELVVSQKKGLPLVSVAVNFVGGSYQFEDSTTLGVATLTAQMLTEGTATRSGDQLGEAMQLLGIQVAATVGTETGSLGFTALSDQLEPAFELLADMLLNPSFPAEALERRKGQVLVALTQQKDQPTTIATKVFTKVSYGDDHPYGRRLSEAATSAITRADVVAFHQAYFRPGRAIVTVVGDVDPMRVRVAFEKSFVSWTPGGERPVFSYPALSAPRPTTIYLVDRPKAAQSVVNIGGPGPARDTPDYYAISIMNFILGGSLQSRLSSVVRETKGYSYGISSGFTYGKGPGLFTMGSSVVTAKSDSALIEIMNVFRGVQGATPFTETEIVEAKRTLIQRLPNNFASVASTAAALSGIYLLGLPETYYQEYASKIDAVTSDDLVRVAKKYVDLNSINIVIVGDRAAIEEPLRKAGIAPILLMDSDGKPLPAVTP